MNPPKAQISIMQKIISTIISKRGLDNLSYYYLIRNIYKRLMSINGISNITIILKNTTYVNTIHEINPLIKICKNTNDINNLKYPERLKSKIKNDFFAKGSTLFAIVIENVIIGYSWLHKNFEPDGDIDLLGIKKFYAVGPTFIRTDYRNRSYSRILFQAICETARNENKWPIYTGIEIDNIPIIKARRNTGYILKNIIIRTKAGEPIIL